MQFDEPTCANCARQTEEEVISTALVPLTVPLYEATHSQTFGVDVITPEEAEKFLTAALTWKVMNVIQSSIDQHAFQQLILFLAQRRGCSMGHQETSPNQGHGTEREG